MNEYNNSGVASDTVWLDHFNAALVEMVDDLDLNELYEFEYSTDQRAYNLPDDYYSIILLNVKDRQRLRERRYYDDKSPGYMVIDKGSHFELDLVFNQPATFSLLYQRYPKTLEYSLISTQRPEVPTAGETALCYKAISHALKNNNQLGQAAHFDSLFKEQIAIIRTATTRARGQ